VPIFDKKLIMRDLFAKVIERELVQMKGRKKIRRDPSER
jgi:hypothetical protein